MKTDAELIAELAEEFALADMESGVVWTAESVDLYAAYLES